MGQSGAMDAINTPEFFARLSRGEPQAIDILYREYAGDMMTFLLKTKRRHGLPEEGWADAVQEVFLKFLSRPLALDPSQKIRPLLMTMVLNEAHDRVTMNGRRANHESNAQRQRLKTAAGAEATGDGLVAAENKVLVEGKLAQLSLSDQQALAAFVKSGPTRHVAALAAATGTNPGAAQMRFLRAKDRWMEALDDSEKRKDTR